MPFLRPQNLTSRGALFARLSREPRRDLLDGLQDQVPLGVQYMCGDQGFTPPPTNIAPDMDSLEETNLPGTLPEVPCEWKGGCVFQNKKIRTTLALTRGLEEKREVEPKDSRFLTGLVPCHFGFDEEVSPDVAVGQKYVPKMEPWQMETWTKTYPCTRGFSFCDSSESHSFLRHKTRLGSKEGGLFSEILFLQGLGPILFQLRD